jgi:predicted TIM-barrel fold metal-dependent hydrolase
MVIDSHVHILNSDDAHLTELLRAADRAGIEKLCISSLARQWVEFPTAEQLEEAANDVMAAVERYPDRFIGFTYVSADHIEKSMELIERCNANGPCQLVKLWISQYVDDPRLDPVFDRARELGQAVMAHTFVKATGNMSRESTPQHAVNRARRHPDVRFWIAHMAARWEEVARIVQHCPSIHMDTSGCEPEEGSLRCLLRHIGPERIFFGSDAPGRSFIVQKSKVLSAELPPEQERLILGENVRRWLRV